MGEVFYNNKSKSIIFIFLLFTLLSAIDAHASYREVDLFNRGYEYYLSYQPQKAVEEFRVFLKAYPDSSLKDAVMFWLGKSSVQLKEFEEAEKVFSDIRQQFPESPYIKYVKRELEIIEKISSEDKARVPAESAETGSTEKKSEILDVSPAEVEKQAPPGEKDGQQPAIEEPASIKVEKNLPLAETAMIDKAPLEDKASVPAESVETGSAEKKSEIPDVSSAEVEKQAPPGEKDGQQPASEEPASIKVEKNLPPEPEIKTASEDNIGIPEGGLKQGDGEKKKEEPDVNSAENEKEILPAKNDSSKVPEEKDKALPAGDEKKSEALLADVKNIDKREAYVADSSYVLAKLDIEDVLWRSGNISEDIENEKALYEEARRLNIEADMTRYEALVLKYELNQRQADYLRGYLAICELIDRKLKDLPEEKFVESLVVKYKEGDKYRKIVISPELQTQAKDGVAFEDIQKLYPDLVSVVLTEYDAVEFDIKEKIRDLENNEIGVIWSEEGYMILKPVIKKLSYKPFEEAGPAVRTRINAFIREWLVELKRTGK